MKDKIHGLDILATVDEVLAAQEAAVNRVAVGEGYTLDVDTFEWNEVKGPDATPCFGRIRSGRRAGDLCMRMAGAGTDHPGFGLCSMHGGNGPSGKREAAWVVAHRFATALDVTPWEGLLWAVKIAAGKVAFIEQKLSEAESDRAFEPPSETSIAEPGRTSDRDGTNLYYWVKQSEFWHDRLTKVSKLAIDAGVAERLVRQLELEAQLMIKATGMTLDELGIEGEQRERALLLMSRNLLALEAEEVGSGAANNHGNAGAAERQEVHGQ